jgi:hypothetical protein
MNLLFKGLTIGLQTARSHPAIVLASPSSNLRLPYLFCQFNGRGSEKNEVCQKITGGFLSVKHEFTPFESVKSIFGKKIKNCSKIVKS